MLDYAQKVDWALGVLEQDRASSMDDVKQAYRDMVMVWHPDKHDSNERLKQKAGEKTRDLNLAMEILTQSWAWSDDTQSWYGNVRGRPANYRGPADYTTDTQEQAVRGPKKPKLADFGLKENYIQDLNKGSKAWEQRMLAIPHVILGVLAVVSVAIGYISSVGMKDSGYTLPGDQNPFHLIWIVPAGVTAIGLLINAIVDRRNLNNEFKPKYHPKPQEYEQFQAALVEYRTQTYIVHVSRSGLMHSNSSCCGMRAATPMPKWIAEERGFGACSHCGNFRLLLRSYLPKPFGSDEVKEEY